MSSYPALLAPLMEASSGKIATESLNETAVLALSYALADREDVIILNETTLRLKGDPAKYTGDTSTDLLIDGEIHSNTVISSDQGYYTQQGTNSATVNIKTFDNTGYHTLTSNATGLYLNTNLEVGTLKYSALDPPIAPSATPSLSDVLTVSGDGGNNNISNISTIDVNTSIKTNLIQAHNTLPNYPITFNCPLNMNNDNIENVNGISTKALTTKNVYSTSSSLNINSAVDFKTNNVQGIGNLNSNICVANSLNTDNTLKVLNQARDNYHVITANAEGLNLNTKFTSDGLILNAVDTGSNITIQNNSSNLVTLETPTGYADLQVGTLKYSTLDPPIAPSATPSLSEVIAVSGDASNQDITNIKDLTAHQLKTSEKIYLGDNVFLSTNTINGNQLMCDAPFTVRNVQATNGMSIYNTTDYMALFEADTPSNQINCYTDGIMKGFGEFESKIITSTGTSGIILKNSDSSFTVDYLGNTKVKELTYESLSPAIPTPSLSDILVSGNSAGINDINMNSNALTNVSFINGIVPEYRAQQEYWVSPSGSDTTGVGSLLSPYATIKKAIEIIELLTDGLPKVINLLQGSYTETNITISKSRISILGENPSGNRADTGCSINSNIIINCTSDNTDMNNNNIYISNLQINGSITNTSSTKNRLIISNCYLYGNSQLLYCNNSTDYRVFMNNCSVSNESILSTDSMVLFSGSGMVSITNCQLTTKSLGSVCEFNGSSRIDTVSNCIFTNDNSSAELRPLLKLTSATTKSIGLCAFVYSSSTPKSTAAPYYSCGILLATPSNSYTVLSLWNNVFSLNGTGAGVSDYAVNQVNSNSSIIIFGNNTSTSSPALLSAHHIIGSLNSTKYAMTSMQ